jgi:predicted nucleic acid-binding protein
LQEDKIIILDTDFLSSVLKIGRLNLVKDFFNVMFLHIPVGVMREISTTDLMNEFLKIDYIKILNVSEKYFGMLKGVEFDSLGTGEKECLALCKQYTHSMLMISDNKARKVARKNGIVVLNIPAFLLACKRTMFLDKNEITLIMKGLKQKDYYEFGKDEKKELLK